MALRRLAPGQGRRSPPFRFSGEAMPVLHHQRKPEPTTANTPPGPSAIWRLDSPTACVVEGTGIQQR
jgi:hypothetical protein